MSDSHKSGSRLRQMRAGSNLVEVINNTASNLDRPGSLENSDQKLNTNHFSDDLTIDCNANQFFVKLITNYSFSDP